MKEFFSHVEYDDVLFRCRKKEITPAEALKEIVDLLDQSRINIFLDKGKLKYISLYNASDYINYTSSIIKIPDKNCMSNHNQVIDVMTCIDEELRIVKDIIGKINEAFDSYNPLWQKVWVERFIFKQKVEKVIQNNKINNKRYYSIMNNSEWLLKKSFNLVETYTERQKRIIKAFYDYLGIEPIY